MGCHVSEREEQAHDPSSPSSSVIAATSKRFKVPKNFLDGCNGVHHASVPRKLRSAMKKKRSCESMLLDSEKVNHKINGIESPKKGGIKKSKKQEISQGWSQRVVVSGPITKDEEEVAETLYALAGMFPNNCVNDSKELGESLPKSSSILEELQENAFATFEASGTAHHTSSCPESSAREATKISSLHETIGQEQVDFPERSEFLMASHSTTPAIDLQTMPMMNIRSDISNKVSSHDPELCLAMGLNMPKQSQIPHFERKPVVKFETAKDVDCKQEQHMLKDQKVNGLALWPSLSPVASANKAPNWLEAAIFATKQDLMMESCSSSKKSSEVVTHKRSWKRCAAHVHITHIIRSLEMPKRRIIEEPELHECHQTRASHEGSKHGVLLELENSNGMRNGLTSAPGTDQFSTMRNHHETKNGILQQQCNFRDISQAAPTTHGVYGPQKQSFNFLPLSCGSNGLKVDNSYNKNGTRLEALSKLQVPYFQSLPQQLISFPTAPQGQYASASASYLDQLSVPGAQVRLQQSQYYGSPLCHYGSSTTVTTVSSKQQHQSFWAMQLAAQGRSAVNCNIMRNQYPNWEGGRHSSDYAVSPCAQAIFPRSTASLETLGSKITSVSGQQRQLITSIQEKWARPPSPFCI